MSYNTYKLKPTLTPLSCFGQIYHRKRNQTKKEIGTRNVEFCFDAHYYMPFTSLTALGKDDVGLWSCSKANPLCNYSLMCSHENLEGKLREMQMMEAWLVKLQGEV